MSDSKYDIIVIGTGPGGYETAIRATQLGLRTAVVEKNKLGGVCLNIGCIPTKALLKSAELLEYSRRLSDYGIALDGEVRPDFESIVSRSRSVADKMNKGVQFLMKKNKIDVVPGHARFTTPNTLEVSPSVDMDGNEIGKHETLSADHIIVATGARARAIPPLPVDGNKIITYKEAMLQRKRPKRLIVVGGGAIGVEFAYFYHNMGSDVAIIEMLDRLVPVEDADVSKELERSFKKMGVKVLTSAQVESVDLSAKHPIATVRTATGVVEMETHQILSAVGVVGNTEDLGLERIGVQTAPGRIVVDDFGRTNVRGVYAIGDVAGGPWLAHKASHEGIICVEKIAGLDVHPLDKNNIPGCTYCQPQIASTGFTENGAREAGYDVKVGKFPFSASGKASAIGHNQGFLKIIYDAQYGELLGCHIIGHDATELIAEVVTARHLETTSKEIMEATHPHPTLSEAVMEATRAAYDISINT